MTTTKLSWYTYNRLTFAVDDINQNLSFLDALTHSMEWVILQTFYWVSPHSGGILLQTVKMDELQVVGHI